MVTHHGTEMPAMTSPLVFGCGFVAATALLHVAGLIAGMCAGSRSTLGLLCCDFLVR